MANLPLLWHRIFRLAPIEWTRTIRAQLYGHVSPELRPILRFYLPLRDQLSHNFDLLQLPEAHPPRLEDT